MAGRLLDAVTKLLAELCGWLLLIVMSLIVIDLVSRAMSTPIYGVSESAMFVMIAIVYLGLPYAEKMQAHVRVELVLDNLPPQVAAVVDLVMYVLVAATMLIVLYAVGLNALGSYEGRQAIAGPTPLLIWPVKFVMVTALALFVVRIFINLVHAVRAVIGAETPRYGGS
ncbi:TRAP-type mannitol/chloroaromatic compound transport system, small permease component [Tranquillimonas rosea]|uniref:TRAP transporter small permease protein n=1 Tax=Tranquillimonas rosea TaxID=641238 RepID=A0A1H9WPJ4_9RHOB|nr:TRAP transporter small permease subunit [Tranquillimonas rosea]SES35795.1 TRAP-type mannitol/chloroaromatic compound transport system, small permease component [Tranquillimonas rosea]